MNTLSSIILSIPEFAKQHFNQRYFSWRREWKNDHILLVFSAIYLAAGMVLMALGGLYTGFYTFHDLGHQILPDVVWAHITFQGDTMVALVLALFVSYRFPQIALAILIGAIAGTFLIHGLKELFETPRPPAILDAETFTVIGPAFKSNSMPSGHTATAFILAGLFTRCVKNVSLKGMLLGGAFLIGWSRIVCGVHWPVDMCFGAALGLFAAWVGLYLSDRIKLRFTLYVIVVGLLFVAALLLLEEDGGFEYTGATGKILSILAMLTFVAYWLRAYLRDRHGIGFRSWQGLSNG